MFIASLIGIARKSNLRSKSLDLMIRKQKKYFVKPNNFRKLSQLLQIIYWYFLSIIACLYLCRYKNSKEHHYTLLSKLKFQPSKLMLNNYWSLIMSVDTFSWIWVFVSPAVIHRCFFFCRYSTVDKLQQSYIFIPHKFKVLFSFIILIWITL